jgi:transposase
MDVLTASHDELLALLRQQQAVIAALQATNAALEQRIRDLERERGTPRGMPGHKPGPAPERRPRQPRRPRQQQFTRPRGQPTRRVLHAVTHCPTCGLALAGGSVKRTREVIEVEPTPVTITEHVYLERCCPGCGRRHTPAAELGGVVVGQSRLGVRLVSLIATLREEARLPLRAIQRHLASVHGVDLSVGALVGALGQVARAGQPAVAALAVQVRASPVVHADETGWREAGHNGFIWTFSTPDRCYLTHGGRGKSMVDRVLAGAEGVLVSDFYAAYDHYPGAQQKCWAHLLRDLHDLRVRSPADAALATWADAIQTLYTRAVAQSQALPAEAPARQQLRHTLMADLTTLCQPWLADATAPQAVLCRRLLKYQHALFVFVLDPAVPSTNNAAERSLRHLVIARKISGGTRSAAGTTTRRTLASLFGSWRLRGLNPYHACQQLLVSPQL